MNNTRVRKKESFLKGKTKELFISELKQILNGKVVSAYLFGSFVTNQFNADSDLDLILIAHSNKPFIERPLEFPELLNLDLEVDLLVYTPEEFEKIRKEDNKVGFWKTVFSQMMKII